MSSKQNGRQNTVPDPVAENVEAIAVLHRKAEQAVTPHQRLIERLAAHLARPRTLYLVVVIAILWVVYNSVARRFGLTAPDPPPFTWLGLTASLSSLLVATMIFITQNRQAAIAEQRSRLDVQINLLAEQKVAKLIALMEELRRDLPNVRDRHDPEAEVMKESANPHAVLEELERTMEALANEEAEEAKTSG